MHNHELSAARYRRLARECLEMARAVASADSRAALEEMAQVWVRLAEQQDAASIPSVAQASQPVIQQQQQQVQPKDDDKKD